MNYSGSYREPLGDVDVCKNIITKLFANYNFYNIQVDVEKETKKKTGTFPLCCNHAIWILA